MPEHISIRSQIENIRAGYDKAAADGVVTAVEWAILVGDVGGIIKHFALTFVGTEAHFAAELRDGEAAFNEYIVPIDFPGVGPILEPWVEQGTLRAIIQGAHTLRQVAIQRNPSLAGG